MTYPKPPLMPSNPAWRKPMGGYPTYTTEIEALQAIIDDPNCTAAERRNIIKSMALVPADQPYTT